MLSGYRDRKRLAERPTDAIDPQAARPYSEPLVLVCGSPNPGLGQIKLLRRTSYEDRVAHGDRAGCLVVPGHRAKSAFRNHGSQGE
jgi:hypothetical protein